MKRQENLSFLRVTNPKSVYNQLANECGDHLWIRKAFEMAWADFAEGKFKYDGATFVAEQYEDSLWEVAAFIHDWLNSIGFIGKEPDIFFIEIMATLGYSSRKIFERAKWMQWTFFNKLRHKLKGTFVADAIPEAIAIGSPTQARIYEPKSYDEQ